MKIHDLRNPLKLFRVDGLELINPILFRSLTVYVRWKNNREAIAENKHSGFLVRKF